ncbi:MAG: Gfo/Idh/MocA family oxidoreductase [bacterium]|nr:Gfo/Idh/MocA family oxidoreductase [bacterium]
MKDSEPVGVAIVGLGNWGRNHVRTLMNLKECRVRWIHDISPQAVEAQLALYPSLAATDSLGLILNDPEVRAVVIASSARSHYEIARAALLAGKDVFIEKPMTLRLTEAEEICRLAREGGRQDGARQDGARIVQVGHLFLHHPSVQYVKKLIEAGELGEVYYIYSQRLNLGVVRNDENSLWSLAPHDISLTDYLLGGEPESLKATGGCYLQTGIEDVIFLTLTYPGGRLAHIHVSWLDPHKIRRLTIVGSRKMVVFDDMETTEKIRIYDKGISRLNYENYGESLSIRTGDIHIPSVPNTEPLKLQMQHFIACVRERRRPLVGAEEGMAVVRTLTLAGCELGGMGATGHAGI